MLRSTSKFDLRPKSRSTSRQVNMTGLGVVAYQMGWYLYIDVLTEGAFAGSWRALGQSLAVDLIAVGRPQAARFRVADAVLALAQPPLIHVECGAPWAVWAMEGEGARQGVRNNDTIYIVHSD